MSSTRPKQAKVMRIHPEGATLARATGAPVVVGDTLSDGETVTLATPTGSGGALTLDASLTVTVRMVRAPVPPAIKVVLASSGGPSTVAEVEAVRSSLLSIGAAQAEPDVKPIAAPIFESGFRSATDDTGHVHVGSIGVRRSGEIGEGVPK